RGLYQRRGYFEVVVRPEVRRAGSATTVVFAITEGVRARLARIELLGLPGDPALAPDALRAKVAIHDGDAFDYAAYDAAKAALLGAVQEAGYAYARLDATAVADPVHHEAVIRLAFTPGTRCSFGDVTLSGVDGDLAGAARARIAVRTGER